MAGKPDWLTPVVEQRAAEEPGVPDPVVGARHEWLFSSRFVSVHAFRLRDDPRLVGVFTGRGPRWTVEDGVVSGGVILSGFFRAGGGAAECG